MSERLLEVAVTAVTDPNFYVGVAAFIAAVALPLLSRRRGKLFFDVVCAVKMFDEDTEDLPDDEKRRISILGSTQTTLVVLDLQNPVGRFFGGLGGQDIDPDQYVREISFSFGRDATVLQTGLEVCEQHPPEIQAEIYTDSSHKDRLYLKKVLLNQGDWLRVSARIQHPSGRRLERNVAATGRILGVRKIQKRRSASKFFNYWLLLSVLSSIPYYLFYVPTMMGQNVSEISVETYWAEELIPRSVVSGFTTTAFVASLLMLTIAIVKYCRKWVVVRHFKHLTLESWVPQVLVASVYGFMPLALGMGVYGLASYLTLGVPYWLLLLISFVLGLPLYWFLPRLLAKLINSVEKRIRRKRGFV